MAGGGADRTEAPTPRRREEARKRGQVARSADVPGALVLGAGLLTVVAVGGGVVERVAQVMRTSFHNAVAVRDAPPQAAVAWLGDALAEVVAASAPFAVACLAAGAAAAVAQVGFKPSAEALKPQWRRIDPLQGIKRLLGPHGLFEAAKASVKVAVVGAILAAAVVPSIPDLAAAVGMPPAALGARLVDELVDITGRAVVAYLAIAAADYAWQRRQHERSLRMTRREVQDELRHYGLAPEVKQALRRRQAQLARQRMMAAVPTADVVVTNPTHVAVALRYDGSKPAPEVVAKGKGWIAQRIREIAAAHGIPIVSDPPLARSLEREVPLGQQIPAHFYQAVAEVLAFVYRQAARRRRVA